MRHLWCLRLSWCSRPQRGRWGLRLGRILHIDAHVGHAFHSLDGLPDSTVFVLRAIVQLDWADLDDIVKVTALPGDRVADALRFGSRRGYFDIIEGRYRINWDWFRAVSRFLERRHLLSSGLRS